MGQVCKNFALLPQVDMALLQELMGLVAAIPLDIPLTIMDVRSNQVNCLLHHLAKVRALSKRKECRAS